MFAAQSAGAPLSLLSTATYTLYYAAAFTTSVTNFYLDEYRVCEVVAWGLLLHACLKFIIRIDNITRHYDDDPLEDYATQSVDIYKRGDFFLLQKLI